MDTMSCERHSSDLDIVIGNFCNVDTQYYIPLLEVSCIIRARATATMILLCIHSNSKRETLLHVLYYHPVYVKTLCSIFLVVFQSSSNRLQSFFKYFPQTRNASLNDSGSQTNPTLKYPLKSQSSLPTSPFPNV